MVDREALADYALEFLKVDDLLERSYRVQRPGTDPANQHEYRETLRRQRAELFQKMREAAGLSEGR